MAPRVTRLSGEARKAIVVTTSSTFGQASKFAFGIALRLAGVSMIDGATPFTRMPSFATCPFRKFHPVWIGVMGENHRIILAMFAVLHALGMFIADLFKSRCGG